MIATLRSIARLAVIFLLVTPTSCKRSDAPSAPAKEAGKGSLAEKPVTPGNADRIRLPKFAKAGPRVALIGIDAADWNAINPLIAQGKLPGFRYLKEKGVWARLKSIRPMLSPPLWTTIVTGKTRAKHGITDFLVANQEGGKVPVTNNFRRVKALWNIATDRGLSAGFINWWPSFPADEVNGYIVSNYTRYYYPQILVHQGDIAKALDSVKSLERIVYPEDLKSLLKDTRLPESRFLKSLDLKKVTSHRLGKALDPALEVEFKDAFKLFSYVTRGDELICNLSLKLLTERKTDLFGVYFEGLDTAKHLFWRYAHPDEHVDQNAARDLGGIIDAYYQFNDEMIGDLLERFSSSTNVIVVSDHGYGQAGKGHYHREEGIIVLAGPAFKKGAKLKQASILDVTPTVLYLLDLPLAKDMDGKPLFSAFSEEFKSTHPPKWIETYESAGARQEPRKAIVTPLDDQMLEKLRALGYME